MEKEDFIRWHSTVSTAERLLYSFGYADTRYRAGKTSIQEVVFNSVPPKDTFYLETTTSIRKMDIE